MAPKVPPPLPATDLYSRIAALDAECDAFIDECAARDAGAGIPPGSIRMQYLAATGHNRFLCAQRLADQARFDAEQQEALRKRMGLS
jgi:hypothetical protein